jgi:hypothetical protein
MLFPLTVPIGDETNATVEGIKPMGNVSVRVTPDAELCPTCNVRSYRTVSPALAVAGPVLSSFRFAGRVGVAVAVDV